MRAGSSSLGHLTFCCLPIGLEIDPNPAGEAFDMEPAPVLGSWNAVAPEAAADYCSPIPHMGSAKLRGGRGLVEAAGLGQDIHACFHSCLRSASVPHAGDGS